MCAFIKGMGAGMAAGLCLGLSLSMDRRRSKKMLHKAVRGMNDMLDNFADNLGL